VVLAMGVVQTFELGMPLALEQMRDITLRVLAPAGAVGSPTAQSRTRAKAPRSSSRRGRSR